MILYLQTCIDISEVFWPVAIISFLLVKPSELNLIYFPIAWTDLARPNTTFQVVMVEKSTALIITSKPIHMIFDSGRWIINNDR